VLAQIQKENPQMFVVYRHLPLIGTPEQPFHDKAALSAQAAEAAGKQGKFWEMHDLLFESQAEWASFTPDQFQSWVVEQAVELELDKEKFSKDLVAKENVDKVQATWDHGVAIGLQSTPFLLINGQIWPTDLPMTAGNIAAIVRLNLLEKDQFTACPPMAIDPSKEYVATLHTEKGDIKMQLFADKAPIAVNNFIFLAKQGWWRWRHLPPCPAGFRRPVRRPKWHGFRWSGVRLRQRGHGPEVRPTWPGGHGKCRRGFERQPVFHHIRSDADAGRRLYRLRTGD
jgi:hypothetical protein